MILSVQVNKLWKAAPSYRKIEDLKSEMFPVVEQFISSDGLLENRIETENIKQCAKNALT